LIKHYSIYHRNILTKKVPFFLISVLLKNNIEKKTETKYKKKTSFWYHIRRDGDVATVCNLYLTLVEVVRCFNRLIINLSGAFLTVAVVDDDEQEETRRGEDRGDDNKIISGEDESSMGLNNCSTI
jgi:hypothetical protein